MTQPTIKMLRTQKAKGIAHLGSRGPFCGYRTVSPFNPYSDVGYAIFPYSNGEGEGKFPIFARPCPVRPRHGFVESRRVYSNHAFARVVMETYAQEAEAEIVLMSPLSGRFSSIASPHVLTIGRGNDGATAGKKGTISIPCPVGDVKRWNTFLDLYSYLTPQSPDEVLYLETVEHNGHVYAVQLRYGPDVGDVSDFIPKEMEVKAVVCGPTEMDLIAWEQEVKKWEKGTVMWWKGGTLTSHYAVHCIQNDIPFLTGQTAPKVGDVIKPIKRIGKVTKMGRELMAKYVKEEIANLRPLSHDAASKEVQFLLSVSHAHSIWGNKDMFARLRARALVSLIRLSAIACIGEARHFFTSGPGRKSSSDPDFKKREAKIDWSALLPGVDINHGEYGEIIPYRKDVYNFGFKFSLEQLMEANALAEQDLAPPGWVAAVGGAKWASSSMFTRKAWEALQAFLTSPGAQEWRALMEIWNLLCNAVHNNGPLLTKWLPSEIIKFCPIYPSLTLGAAGDVILQTLGLLEVTISPEEEEQPEVDEQPEEEEDVFEPDPPEEEQPEAVETVKFNSKWIEQLSNVTPKSSDPYEGHYHVTSAVKETK